MFMNKMNNKLKVEYIIENLIYLNKIDLEIYYLSL